MPISKRKYNPLINNNQKTLSFSDTATDFEKITKIRQCFKYGIIETKTDFVREVVPMRDITVQMT